MRLVETLWETGIQEEFLVREGGKFIYQWVSKVKSYTSLDQTVTKDTSSPRRENLVAGQPMGP